MISIEKATDAQLAAALDAHYGGRSLLARTLQIAAIELQALRGMARATLAEHGAREIPTEILHLSPGEHSAPSASGDGG
jgi:hypothetical protein